MSLAESFKSLFESMTILTASLWITGFVLFCIEFFQPMRGVAYALGGALLAAALVSLAVTGNAGAAFVFILITAELLFCVHIVSLYTQRRDWLHVARIKKAGERTKRYGKLIDGIGVAITPIDMTGNAKINDVNLVVYSETPIPVGARVRITEITADRITVRRLDETENR